MYQPPPPMTKGGALSLQGLIGNSDDHTCTATTQSNCYTTAHATGLQVVSNCCPSQMLADCSPTVCTMDCTLRQPFNNDSTCYETTAPLLRLQANCHDTAHGTARDTSQTTLHCACYIVQLYTAALLEHGLVNKLACDVAKRLLASLRQRLRLQPRKRIRLRLRLRFLLQVLLRTLFRLTLRLLLR